MALNLAALGRKLSAIKAKDVDRIVAERVYLPFVGNDYTRAALVAWLKKRSDILEQVRDGNYTDAQIENYIVGVYQGLSAADKVIALQIRNGQRFDLSEASSLAAYDDLCMIVLAKFVIRNN